MTKVDVIATRRAKFAKPGTRRTFTTSEARVLVLLGQATYVVSGSEVPRRGYLRRDMVANGTTLNDYVVAAEQSATDREQLQAARQAIAPRAAAAAAEPPHRPRARRASHNATDVAAATTAQHDDGEA